MTLSPLTRPTLKSELRQLAEKQMAEGLKTCRQHDFLSTYRQTVARFNAELQAQGFVLHEDEHISLNFALNLLSSTQAVGALQLGSPVNLADLDQDLRKAQADQVQLLAAKWFAQLTIMRQYFWPEREKEQALLSQLEASILNLSANPSLNRLVIDLDQLIEGLVDLDSRMYSKSLMPMLLKPLSLTPPLFQMQLIEKILTTELKERNRLLTFLCQTLSIEKDFPWVNSEEGVFSFFDYYWLYQFKSPEPPLAAYYFVSHIAPLRSKKSGWYSDRMTHDMANEIEYFDFSVVQGEFSSISKQDADPFQKLRKQKCFSENKESDIAFRGGFMPKEVKFPVKFSAEDAAIWLTLLAERSDNQAHLVQLLGAYIQTAESPTHAKLELAQLKKQVLFSLKDTLGNEAMRRVKRAFFEQEKVLAQKSLIQPLVSEPIEETVSDVQVKTSQPSKRI